MSDFLRHTAKGLQLRLSRILLPASPCSVHVREKHMEDPWVNAWGDPQKSSAEIPTKPPLASAWSSSNFVTDDQADIAVPSWEPETGAIWDDSPDLQKDLWSRDNRTSGLWSVPTFESIGFAKPSQESLSADQPEPLPGTPPPQENEYEAHKVLHAKDNSGHDVDAVPSRPSSKPDPKSELDSPDVTQESVPESVNNFAHVHDGDGPKEDVDGFGTFEDAEEGRSQSDPWVPAHQPLSQFEDAGEWGETWKEPEDVEDDGEIVPVDEWELAKRQKEMQDRYVPPELLGSILGQFDEFATDYWSGEPSGSNVYQPNRDELAETLGISSMIDRFIPSDLTLPPTTPIVKTFISKEMIEALKLTKHLIVTRNSPLAVYMNSKGSLSWEASVKSKPDVTETDVIPSGWRVVPKEGVEQQAATNDPKKKASGGLLSFFGRKSTPSAPPSGSSSPIRSNTPVGTSPRASITSSRQSIDIKSPTSAVVKIIASSSSKESDAVPSATMTALAEISSTGKTDTSPQPEELVQTPSAVSRFLGRFSRSNKSSANSRGSIALSSDDLEFLSDIVPSVHDDMDDLDKLEALSTAIRTPSIPTKLPPPLAPPPKAPLLPKPLSPPPSTNSRPLSPTKSAFTSGDRLNTVPGFIESQLFDLIPDFPSQHQSAPSLQVAPLSFFTVPQVQASETPVIPLPLPPPLSPSTTPRSRTPVGQPTQAALPNSFDSSFDDDDFSDFQTSPNKPSAPQISLDSALSSFTNPQVPENPLSASDEPASFDDFDDFVSPPPQVPEKPSFISPPRPTPHIQPVPSIPSITSTLPTKLPATLHQRRISTKQADSDQRTLNLLEAAAGRGRWPAPPSPLPNAIPPPTTNNSAGNNLFDVFEDTGGLPTSNAVTLDHGLSSLSSPSNSISSPTLLGAPPPMGAAINGKAADTSSSGGGSRLGGTGSPPPSAPVMSPPPLIPPRPPMKPIIPLAQSQTQGDQRNLQSQLQWNFSLPPSNNPLSSFMAQPASASTSFGFGHGGSATPLQQPLQQQKPVENAFPSLFDSAPTAAPHARNGSTSSSQNPGSGGGKLSAQDLSFFERL